MSEGEPPGTGTIRIPDVPLQMILQHLQVKDLLDCRLVNKQWSVVAQIVLQTRRSFIDLDKVRRIPVATDEHLGEAQVMATNLKFLSERLQTDKYFPFVGIIISVDNWHNQTEVQEFSRNFGKFFHRLYLKKIPSPMVAEMLGRCFPNIRHLIIEPTPGVPNDRTDLRNGFWEAAPLALDEKMILLPSLEHITIVDDRDQFVSCDMPRDMDCRIADYSVVKRIIEAVPSLKKLDNFQFWLYPCLLDCGKLETISKLSVDYKFFATRAHYVSFADNVPALKSLEICNSDPSAVRLPKEPQGWNQRRAESEIKILSASQYTLKHLAIERLSGPLPLFPSLKSLWILKDGRARGWPYKIFATDESPSSSFPALETVRIFLETPDGYDYDLRWTSHYFRTRRGHCIFASVQTLELVGTFNCQSFSRLRTIFPSIKTLRVHWQHFIRRDKRLVSDLWACGWDLVELEIYGYDDNWTTLTEFEAFLKGISQRTFKSLRRKLILAPVNPAEIDALRTKPRICALTGLRSFRVFFSGNSMGAPQKDQETSTNAIPLAFSYGLGLMPGLQTIFEYDFRADSAAVLAQALAPYASVVSIQHRPNDEGF